MKYAVIRLQGHQYKVSEGEEILVDKIKEKQEFAAKMKQARAVAKAKKLAAKELSKVG